MSNDTETLTLTEFLLARIAKDEADPGCEGQGEYASCREWSERQDREAEAKRRIVELHYSETFETKDADGDDRVATWCHECMEADDWPCPTLRILAAVYADHPDYRNEWKP